MPEHRHRFLWRRIVINGVLVVLVGTPILEQLSKSRHDGFTVHRYDAQSYPAPRSLPLADHSHVPDGDPPAQLTSVSMAGTATTMLPPDARLLARHDT